ncbi:hypothetical protein F511_21624 [Dorcoceras hygrometricum]|uniref:Transmembrane protein n=1 Tax=Dorcoceras hygrometricum TaxID=472368 RepID=A0A2Z7D0V9_9LAMI|nr:hypothetical protein F511_21624 [Dorcoceras hygrometricum]
MGSNPNLCFELHFRVPFRALSNSGCFRVFEFRGESWSVAKTVVAVLLRLVLCEELLRLDKQSRAMVNAGQLSCSSKRMRRHFVVVTGSPATSEFRRYCLRLQLVLRSEHPKRRRLDKLVRRRFEDQSMVCFSLVCGIAVPAGCVLLRIVYAICVFAALHMFICWHSRMLHTRMVFLSSFGSLCTIVALLLFSYQDVRASGNTALSSPCWDRSHHEPSG